MGRRTKKEHTYRRRAAYVTYISHTAPYGVYCGVAVYQGISTAERRDVRRGTRSIYAYHQLRSGGSTESSSSDYSWVNLLMVQLPVRTFHKERI